LRKLVQKNLNGAYEWNRSQYSADNSLPGQKTADYSSFFTTIFMCYQKKILKIDWFWVDFCLYFQYDFDLSGVKSISELKKRLLEVRRGF